MAGPPLTAWSGNTLEAARSSAARSSSAASISAAPSSSAAPSATGSAEPDTNFTDECDSVTSEKVASHATGPRQSAPDAELSDLLGQTVNRYSAIYTPEDGEGPRHLKNDDGTKIGTVAVRIPTFLVLQIATVETLALLALQRHHLTGLKAL